METIADALEDAQYLDALYNATIRPLKQVEFPLDAEVEKFMEDLSINNPSELELERICERPLGFYLFTRYLQNNVSSGIACFLIESARIIQENYSDYTTAELRDLVLRYLVNNKPKELTLPYNNFVAHLLNKIKLFEAKYNEPISIKQTQDNSIQLTGKVVDRILKRIDISTTHLVSSQTNSSIHNPGSTQNSIRSPVSSFRSSAGQLPSKPYIHGSMSINLKDQTSGQAAVTAIAIAMATNNSSNPNSSNDSSNSQTSHPNSNPVTPLHSNGSFNHSHVFHSKSQNDLADHDKTTMINSILNNRSGKATGTLIRPFPNQNEVNDWLLLDYLVFNIVKISHFEDFKDSPDYYEYFQWKLWLKQLRISYNDFTTMRTLGRGGFGRVSACRHMITGKLFAIKAMSKKRIKVRKAELVCLHEKKALSLINSPFVVGLHYSFSTKDELFLVLDLMVGGSVAYHLSKLGKFPVNQAKYYTARTILAISVLHSHRMICRDLKPENILLDAEGKSKLCDLGLVCFVGDKEIRGACGTRGYLAPEMLTIERDGTKTAYTYTVDWFSLGCCVYAFFTGHSPFRSEMARNWGAIANGNYPVGAPIPPSSPGAKAALELQNINLATLEMEPEYHKIEDEEARDLISKLLCKNPYKRLGANGPHEIMRHSWFKNLAWDKLHILKAPYIPGRESNADSNSEIGDFPDEKEISKLPLDIDNSIFHDWDYIWPTGTEEEVVELLIHKDLQGVNNLQGSMCCSIN